MHIDLPDNYGYVLLASVCVALQCYLVGFTIAQGKRRKYFTKEFLDQNFGEEHKKEFNTSVPQQGYPDHGSGRYSQKLPYKAWFELNNAQRCHQNFLETVGLLIFGLLVSGLYFTQTAAILGAVHFVGRVLYIAGYVSKRGADGRLIGAFAAHGTTLIALVLAAITSAKFAHLL